MTPTPTVAVRINALIHLLKGHAVNSPEARLMLAVFSIALHDLHSDYVHLKRSGKVYLRGNLPHLQAIGLNPEWVRKMTKRAGL